MTIKQKILTSLLMLGVSLMGVNAFAQTCSGSNISVGTSQSCSTVRVTSNTEAISNAGTISGINYGIYFSSYLSTSNITIGTITNTTTGIIGSSSEFYGVYQSSAPSGANQSVTSTINNINNSGAILGSFYAIYSNAALSCGSGCNNSSSIVNLGSIVNSGTISSASGRGIFNSASVGGFGYVGVTSTSTINSISNSGSIYGRINGIENTGNDVSGTNTVLARIDSIQNTGSITSGSSNPESAIKNSGSIGSVSNSGAGLINAYIGIANDASGTIQTITNTATISANNYGIVNYGTISTLNNGQGVGNASGALTLYQNLPSQYNVIINSRSNYGQLAVNGAALATTFGIYAGSVVAKGTYASVLSGVTSSNLNNTSGNYNGFTWTLGNSSGNIWDITFTGASTADTQASLQNTANVLQGTYTLQNSVLTNSFSYDCTVFGANNLCVSAGGRNTAVSAANGLNNTSALLIAAYRVMPSVRVGAYADQNLSVNNAGSTVNLGNNTPLIGLFGAWNERQDGTGTEVKVSATYGQKNTTVTRSVVGTSEAGSGGSNLNSQGVQATGKYGFAVTPEVIVSPYAGIRYTQNNMGGYTESSSTSVTAPLTYSALNTNATTALAGVGVSYKVIPTVTTFASAGVETDTNTSNGTYSATGVTGLTPINFNANPVKTRPTATVGAYYDIEKNQRLGITGIYRQEPYQAVSTTTVMATYTIGL